MISKFLRRFVADAEDNSPLAEEEERTAVAALLVIAAHADHDYADAEKAQIERVLARRYELDPAGAAALRAEGEEAEHAAMDMYRFTSRVKQHIPYEERASVVEAMWHVVLSDKVRDPREETLMRRVTDLLGLDPRDSIDMRRRVERN